MQDAGRKRDGQREVASGLRHGRTGRRGDTHHLLRGHADRLDAELAAAHVEEVFEVGPEQVNDEDIVQTLLTKVVDLRNALYQGGMV